MLIYHLGEGNKDCTKLKEEAIFYVALDINSLNTRGVRWCHRYKKRVPPPPRALIFSCENKEK